VSKDNKPTGEAHFENGDHQMEIEARLDQLGLILPDLPTPVGAYLLSRQSGDLLFLSGTTCYVPGGLLYKGRLGADLDVQQGYAAARQTMLNLLGVVKTVLGDLDRVASVIKVNGYVNSTPDFERQPEVINGASELLEQIFGERGRHARTSIGVNILPGNIPVEIEMVVQIRDQPSRG
jgi:enamine deaminase RidA (YjgF/YER057c/UK114 family)